MIRITIFWIAFFISPSFGFAASSELLNKVTDGVCECLQASKDEGQSLKGKEFQNCIQKVTKPYAKELKKEYLDKKGADAEQKFMEKLAMQLGMTMISRCPDMLEFIMQEIPELQEGN